MKYEQDILNLLISVGDAGLTLQSIVKHVYNANNSFFEPLKESNVYQSVRSYLLRNTRNEHSLYLKGEDNKYRLNLNASIAQTLTLQFTEKEDTPSVSPSIEPLLPFDFD